MTWSPLDQGVLIVITINLRSFVLAGPLIGTCMIKAVFGANGLLDFSLVLCMIRKISFCDFGQNLLSWSTQRDDWEQYLWKKSNIQLEGRSTKYPSEIHDYVSKLFLG